MQYSFMFLIRVCVFLKGVFNVLCVFDVFLRVSEAGAHDVLDVLCVFEFFRTCV